MASKQALKDLVLFNQHRLLLDIKTRRTLDIDHYLAISKFKFIIMYGWCCCAVGHFEIRRSATIISDFGGAQANLLLETWNKKECQPSRVNLLRPPSSFCSVLYSS